MDNKIKEIEAALVETYREKAKELGHLTDSEMTDLMSSTKQSLRFEGGLLDLGTTAEDIYDWLDGMPKEDRERAAIRCSRGGNYIVLSIDDWYQIEEGDDDDSLNFPKEKES